MATIPNSPARRSAYFAYLAKRSNALGLTAARRAAAMTNIAVAQAAPVTPARIAAARANGKNARKPGDVPLATLVTCWYEAVEEGLRPACGPQLIQALREKYGNDKKLAAIIKECDRGTRTTWTLVNRAKEKMGLPRYVLPCDRLGTPEHAAHLAQRRDRREDAKKKLRAKAKVAAKATFAEEKPAGKKRKYTQAGGQGVGGTRGKA